MSEKDYVKRLDRIEAIMAETLQQVLTLAEDASKRKAQDERIETMLFDMWSDCEPGDDDEVVTGNGDVPPETGETT